MDELNECLSSASGLISASCGSYQFGFRSLFPTSPTIQLMGGVSAIDLVSSQTEPQTNSVGNHIWGSYCSCVDWFQTSPHFLLPTLLK